MKGKHCFKSSCTWVEMVTQMCYGHFEIKAYLNDCDQFESLFSLCINAIRYIDLVLFLLC